MHVLGLIDSGIDADAWPWIWLVVAVAFTVIELTALAGTFILLPFAGSAFVSSALAFVDASTWLQWTVFLVGGAVLFALGYWRFRRFADENPLPPGIGADRLVGLTGIAVSPIAPDDADRRGRVKVSGELWGALSDDDRPIPEGTRVRVVAMRGTRAVVRPETDDASSTSPEEGASP